MSWPLSHEFNEAVQNPQIAFSDPDLKTGETVVGATGLPLPRSGNFADVYQVRAADGKEWAVKCFTRPVAGLGERYARIGEALAKANLPFAVGFTFLAEGIRVGGVWRPVVKMEWVEGLLLNQVVRENAGKPGVLLALGQMWVRLCKRLREGGVAHADIQHGNVLLVPGTRAGTYGLKLIDYDGMWVSALANTPSGESGHPSYQHPARAGSRAYSPDVDRFPHLVVVTALRGLSVGGTKLWEKYDNGDNLLFTEEDYKKPSESKLMKELWHSGDALVQSLVGRLAMACGKPIPQTPWLDQLAVEGEPTPLDDATRREAAAALGVAAPVSIPLPPEPSAVVIPLPPEPVVVSVPAPVPAPFVFDDGNDVKAEEVDVELVSAPDPVRKKDRSKTAEKLRQTRKSRGEEDERAEGDSSPGRSRLMLFGGGGLLLLVGGIVAAVALSGGKKPPEAVQNHQEEPKPTVTQPADVPKPKGKTPDPPPPPKDPPTDPVVVPTPPATSPLRPGEKYKPQQRWSYKLEDSDYIGSPVLSRDGSTVAITTTADGAVVMLDVANGKLLNSPPPTLNPGGFATPLDGGRFTGGVLRGPTLPVWNPRVGKVVEELPTAGLSVPGLAYVSPSGKYIGSSRNINGQDMLKLRSAQSDTLILDRPWTPGSVHFTDDESRVLVASAPGDCRWYKLPSGEADGEWKFEKKGEEPRSGVKAVSGDGSSVVFWGSFGNRLLGVHVLDGRGHLRGGINQKPPLLQDPTLSRDGHWLLFHEPATDTRQDKIVVTETATGKRAVEFVTPSDFPTFRPVLLPDSSGCVAVVTNGTRRAVVRFDFVPTGETSPVSPAPGEPVVLKPKWTTPTAEFMYKMYVTGSGKIVFGSAGGLNDRRTAGAFDTATGAERQEFAELLKGGNYSFFRLTDGCVGKWEFGTSSITLWDEQTGKSLRKIEVPDILQAPGSGLLPLTSLSPDARFLAVGWWRPNGFKVDSDVPLRVIDLTTKKDVLKLKWSGGKVHFTADSSRVLVAAHNGKCKWYKLPSGEPDVGWDFGVPKSWPHDIVSMSADGSILAYIGPSENRMLMASIDGKTGAFLQRFPSYFNPNLPVVSADGRRMVVPASDRPNICKVTVVEPRTGTVVGRIPTESIFVSSAFSPDGASLVLATDKPATVQLFDLPGVPPPDRARAARLDVRSGWSLELAADFTRPQLHPSADSKLVLVTSNKGAAVTLNSQTGKEAGKFDKLNSTLRLLPLSGGQFAFAALNAGERIRVVDLNTGQEKAVPGIAVPKEMAYQFVSPDLRYVAVGVASREEPLPFKLKDNTDGKLILDFNWTRGEVHFTADSSRVLVAEGSGRCRWFKLPSGEMEKEWTLESAKEPSALGRRLFAASTDGSVLFYDGRLGDRRGAYHVIDGRTGQITRSLAGNYAPQFGTMSADGSLAILPRRNAKQQLISADVIHLATGTVVAEMTPPTDCEYVIPTILPDHSGAVAIVGPPNRVVRYNFVAPGAVAVVPKPPVPMVPEPDLPQLKTKWSIECKTKLDAATPFFDDDGQTLALVATDGPVTAASFKARTGEAIRELPARPGKGHFHHLFALDKGMDKTRFAIQTDVDTSLIVWEPTLGKVSSMSFTPPAMPRGISSVNVSPSGGYLAVGHARPTPGAKNLPLSRLKVIDTSTNFPVVSLDWHVGTTAFTADSSRVLVVDDTDKFRWFNLTTRKPEGEWDFGRTSDGRNAHLMGMSAHGEILLYYGQPPGKEETVHLLNGKDGTVLHSFPTKRHLNSGGSISEDGKHVMLLTDEANGAGHRAEILDTSGKSLAAVKLPSGDGTVAVSWKARLLVTYDRNTRQLTAFELPAITAP